MVPTTYIAAGALAAGLALGAFGGCQVQGRLDAGARSKLETTVAERDATIAQKNGALSAAAAALRGSADALRIADAAGEANAAAAQHAAREASEAAAAAAAARKQADRRVAEIERELAAERDGCVDGRRPICGVPLR